VDRRLLEPAERVQPLKKGRGAEDGGAKERRENALPSFFRPPSLRAPPFLGLCRMPARRMLGGVVPAPSPREGYHAHDHRTPSPSTTWRSPARDGRKARPLPLAGPRRRGLRRRHRHALALALTYDRAPPDSTASRRPVRGRCGRYLIAKRLVADIVVAQVVEQAACHQDAVPAVAELAGGPHLQVADRVAVAGRVRQVARSNRCRRRAPAPTPSPRPAGLPPTPTGSGR